MQRAAQPIAQEACDSSTRRFVLLFSLCLAEYLPISLLYTTIPVLMRKAGASLDDIGALSFAFFPWALKFLWAPVVDRWGSERRGRYRSWLLVLVPVVAALVVGLAFLDLPYMLIHARSIGVGLLVGLTVLCATIDTAAHGLGVVMLAANERGFGNGVQTAGQMVGNLLGGGVAVVCIGWAGWRTACLGLAALYAFPLMATALAREPRLTRDARPRALRDFFVVLRRPGAGRWFAWLAAFGMAYGLWGVPYQAALVDAGLDMTEIGVVQGIVMSVTGLVGGMGAGLFMKRASRRRALYLSGIGLMGGFAMSLATFTVLHAARWALYLGLALTYLTLAAVVTVLYAMMMDRSKDGTASSDFTSQYSALQVSGFVSWGLGAAIANRLGTPAVFAISIALTLVLLLAVGVLFRAGDLEPSSRP